MPSDTDRSKWPTHRQSTPSIAAILSAFSTPSAVSMRQKNVDPLVGGSEFVGNRARPVMVMRDLQRHAALAHRMIFHRIEDVADFIDIADHRQHEPFDAHVHGARDMVVILARHAHDRRKIGGLEIAQRALDRLQAEARMLEIEQGEIAACRFHDVPDAGRCEFNDEMPEFRGFRRFCHGLEAAFSHSRLPYPVQSPLVTAEPSQTRS